MTVTPYAMVSQVRHRELACTVTDSAGHHLPMLANPIRMSETPVNRCVAPPLLGEHTDTVLTGLLGYDARDLARLRAEQAIG